MKTLKSGYITELYTTCFPPASLVDQTVKNLSAMQETRVQFLGWEDSLEKKMAMHSSILGRKIPWTEEPGGLQSMGLQRVRLKCVTNTFTFVFLQLCLKIKYIFQEK